LDLYTTSDRPPAPKLALAFAEAAKQIGVTINVRDVPYTEYAANVARKKPLCTSYWNTSPTLYENLYLIYHSQGRFNYSGVTSSPGLDGVLEALIAEVDITRRKALVADALQRIHDQGDRIIPYFQNYIGATRARVQGFVPPTVGVIETRSIWLSA
jgi:peptide/nickel transport system substrate-binding protein